MRERAFEDDGIGLRQQQVLDRPEYPTNHRVRLIVEDAAMEGIKRNPAPHADAGRPRVEPALGAVPVQDLDT